MPAAQRVSASRRASEATAWMAAISVVTAASAPRKRGSGQKQRERRQRTLKEDVSQPTLPPPLRRKGAELAQRFLEAATSKEGTCLNPTLMF